MLERINEQNCWDRLAAAEKPVVLYGMGDGAERILEILHQKQIAVSAIFASDEYVRGHSFCGFEVVKYSDLCARFDDFVIVMGFAVHDPVMLKRVRELCRLHEFYAPDIPVAGDGLFTREYIDEHELEFDRAFSLLADDLSKKTFLDVLHYKVSGKPEYLFACQSEKGEVYRELLCPDQNEFFADLGAYDGDTIRELLAHTGDCYSRISALEPDARNFRKLSRSTERLERIELYNIAAWDSPSVLYFSKRGGRNSRLSKQGEEIRADALDNLITHPVTLLKMDIEGSESRALDGSKQVIRRDRPKLYICAYHRNRDLFALPLQIEMICPGYKIYLRHHPYIPAWETNLYCLPN